MGEKMDVSPMKKRAFAKLSFRYYRAKPTLGRWDMRCFMLFSLISLAIYIHFLLTSVVFSSTELVNMSPSLCYPKLCWISPLSATQSRIPTMIHPYCDLFMEQPHPFARFKPPSYLMLFIFASTLLTGSLFLTAQWYLSINCFLNYTLISSIIDGKKVSEFKSVSKDKSQITDDTPPHSEEANTLSPTITHVLVSPLNKSQDPFSHAQLCAIQKSTNLTYIHYQQKRFIYNSSLHTFGSVKYPLHLPIEHYISSTGIPQKASDTVQPADTPEGTQPPPFASYKTPQSPPQTAVLHSPWQPSIEKSPTLLLEKYGENRCKLPFPTFLELYKEHLLSPILIFQIVCGMLWLLDDYYMFGLMNLGMLFSIEAMMVRNRLSNIKRINQMSLPSSHVYVYRKSLWVKESIEKVLPGDIICLSTNMASNTTPTPQPAPKLFGPYPQPYSFKRNQVDTTPEKVSICPVDALLLQGSVVANESVLTGESMPQLKQDIFSYLNDDSNTGEIHLDIKGEHKPSLLSAGTSLTLVHNNNAHFKSSRLPAPSHCVVYVLRTGFATTHGKLQRSIYFAQQPSNTSTVSSNKEITYFLLILLAFALMSAGYVLHDGLQRGNSSLFRLILNCSHIIMSVVPPEFPISSSSTISLTIMELVKKHVYCTEPHRLPHAGAIDVCAFDKTGTLTSDTMDVVGIFGFQGDDRVQEDLEIDSKKNDPANDKEQVNSSSSVSPHNKPYKYTPPVALVEFFKNISKNALNATQNNSKDTKKTQTPQTAASKPNNSSSNQPPHPPLPSLTQAIMGTCHSLVLVDSEVIGDPLEKSAFEYLGWSIPTLDCVSTEKPTPPQAAKQPTPPPSAKPGKAIPHNPRFTPHFPPPPTPTLSNHQFNILRRFPFASELQRMTVVCSVSPPLTSKSASSKQEVKPKNESSGKQHFVYCKGSPEKLRQFITHPPDYYEPLAQFLTLRGYRVIALAGKELEGDHMSSASHLVRMDRAHLEENLTFAGFLVFSCPIKANTLESLQSLQQGGFSTIMITGDNPLTGSQVAEDLTMIPPIAKKPIYILQVKKEVFQPSQEKSNSTNFWESKLQWVERKQELPSIPFTLEKGDSNHPDVLCERYTLGLTGDGMSTVSSENVKSPEESSERLQKMIPFISLFFRVTPHQKEEIISTLNLVGMKTLMCGDGANDMGALKSAAVGISLYYLYDDKAKEVKKAEQMKESMQSFRGPNPNPPQPSLTESSQNPNVQSSAAQWAQSMQQKRAALLALEDPDAMLSFKPGDASIAAPFSYTRDHIKCVPMLLRYGRSSLSTIMMTYKLTAISSLVTGFVFSVLTLDGVKSGEIQNVVQVLLMSAAIMIVSKARPSRNLTRHRMSGSLFAPSFLTTIFLQFGVHLIILLIGWQMAKAYRPPFFKPSLDSPFIPNLVNTTIFYLLSSINFSTVLCNYDGEPFLISLKEIPSLRNVLVISIGGLFTVVLELAPNLNNALSLVPLPSTTYRLFLFFLVFIDCFGVWIITHTIRKISLQHSLKTHQYKQTNKNISHKNN